MMDSVLLDTSFCIRLIKTDDEYHRNVLEYYNFFLEKKVKMYLSAIVVSEFCIKDELENLPLRTTRFIPFNLDDAVRAAEYERIAKPIVNSIQRNVVRNDCKLIAQIACRGIQAYITKDKASIKEIIAPIKKEKAIGFEVIDLSIPLNDWLASEKGGLFSIQE